MLKNKKIFLVSMISLILIMFLINICNASTVNYDINDYKNYVDNNSYAIIYSERDDCIYLIVGYRQNLGISVLVNGKYRWASGSYHYSTLRFGNAAAGCSVYTYDANTQTFGDKKDYSYFVFDSGVNTKILASNVDIGDVDTGEKIVDVYVPNDGVVSIDDGTVEPEIRDSELVAAVKKSDTSKVLSEILGILPVCLVVVVSFISIRKAIEFLRNNFNAA